jgi:hypothetical protein
MQPNYNELAERQQRDYQASRDPFQYGQQVAQRRYSEMMSNLDRQRQATQQSYGDLYSQARQRAVGGAAAGGPTLSGGMGQQQRDFVSAIEMQELGRIGQAREGASRDLFSQGQAAFSNAQLEGQQATQMRLQDQQTQLQLVQQRQQILDNKDLTDEQRAQQLAALDGGDTSVQTQGSSMTFGNALSISAGIGIGGGTAAKVLTKVGTSSKAIASIVAKQGAVMLPQAASAGNLLPAIVSKDAATIAAAFKGQTGLAALWNGTKVALMKTGLAKGSLAVVGKGAAAKGTVALTAMGPIGWGILAVLATAGAIYGISKLVENK